MAKIGKRPPRTADAGNGIWDDTWHHIAATYDGATLRLYVDGVEIGDGTATTGDPIEYGFPYGDDDLRIGNYSHVCASASGFIGSLERVRLWDRALSAAEVEERFATCDVLVHATASPGLAGSSNTWTVDGVTPPGSVVLLAGSSGVTPVPGCPGLDIEVASPVVVGTATADADGTARVVRTMRMAAAGKTFEFQAVDRAACAVSNVTETAFP